MKDILLNTLNIFNLYPNYEKRVFGLDLMRALAILFVVMGHGGYILEYANTDFPWIKLIDGVELFFVLSGYLIGGIIIRTMIDEGSLSLKTLNRFWLRRWFRTLPNYYLILIVNIIIVYFGIIKEDINQVNWTFFFFLQNFHKEFYDFFWESWSLSIEEWFYLLFPIILALIYFILKEKISKRFIYLYGVLLFLTTTVLLRVFIASKYQVDDFWLGVRINKVVIFHLDGIALGLLAAYIKRWNVSIWDKYKNYAFVIGIAISYFVLYTEWQSNNYSTKVLRIFIQAIGCALLLPKFDSLKKAPKIIVKVTTHISLISYSMYLINLALVAEVIRDNFPPHGPKSGWAMYFIYWFTVIFASTLLYKYFEKPVMDIRDRFRKA